MAIPIKETPILFGEDARRLRKAMDNVVPETQERKAEMKANYEFFMSMFNRGQRENNGSKYRKV